ncbi:MAG: hypothetical protein IJQ45_02650 [Clostridia bacterium]|nr:hypothetical protein [Clostridia bacterium]
MARAKRLLQTYQASLLAADRGDNEALLLCLELSDELRPLLDHLEQKKMGELHELLERLTPSPTLRLVE